MLLTEFKTMSASSVEVVVGDSVFFLPPRATHNPGVFLSRMTFGFAAYMSLRREGGGWRGVEGGGVEKTRQGTVIH